MIDAPEGITPDESDAFYWPSGPLGSRTSASMDGRYLGEFSTDRRARAAIRLEMSRTRFWPNVWHVDDHGGHTLAPL